MKLNKLTILILIPFLTTCKHENKKEIDSMNVNWQGKEIFFPGEMTFTRLLTDTTLLDFSHAKMKILIYADTADCMGCKLQLNEWKDFMAEVNSATNDTIPFLFFLYPKDMEEMGYLIQSENFDYPICIDSNDCLNKLNHFFSDISLLLDENNHVVAEGNPVHNLDIKNLYLEKITGNKNKFNSIKTTTEIDQSNFDLGTFKKTVIKEIPVKIRNVGNSPLVIFDVNTSCRCMVASFDKQPIRAGDETEVKLKITPTETGFLKKTAKISANIDKLIIVTFQGYVTD